MSEHGGRVDRSTVGPNSHNENRGQGVPAGDESRISRLLEKQAAIEDSLKAFFESTHGFVWRVDPSLRFVHVSPSIQRVLGYTKRELLGTGLPEIAADDERERLRSILSIEGWSAPDEACDVADVRTIDTRFVCKDGSVRPFRLSASVLEDPPGTTVGFFGIANDMTDRPGRRTDSPGPTHDEQNPRAASEVRLIRLWEEMKAEVDSLRFVEAELKEKETRFWFLFEEAPMLISEEDRSQVKKTAEELWAQGVRDFGQYFAEDPSRSLDYLSTTRVLAVNKATRDFLGIESPEEMAATYPTLLGAESPQSRGARAAKIVEWALNGGPMIQDSVVWISASGEEGTGIATFKALPGYEDSWARTWTSVLDTTDLTRTQEALRETEQRFRSVFEAAEDAIFLKDTDLRYTHVNPAMLRLLGKSAEDFIGKTTEEALGAAPQGNPGSVETRVLAGESVEVEQTVPTVNGTLTLSIMRFPIVTPAGETVGLCGIARDVTPRRPEFLRSRRNPESYRSPAMAEVTDKLAAAAETDAKILFLGESGTGKDYFARRLHNISLRSTGPFMPINCAALAPSLVESELFGHEAGSFTGAAARKRGLLELAEGGTVFLNEIAELSLPLQAKLLSFLDTQSFTRIGGERSISVNARVVAATNKDLAEEVTAGTFREDLFYRLNVFAISIPPLRERLDDVPALAEILITDLMNKMTLHEPPEIEPAAMKKLLNYPWPGNVRELRNVLERAAIMSDKKVITAGDVQLREGPSLSGERRLTTRLAVEEGSSLQDALRRSEVDLIRKALDLCAGNVTRSAERLGLTREQLKYRMRSLGIKR